MVCAIWTRFLCHFQNGASDFCTSKTGEDIKQNVNFNTFYMDFAKIALVTIYMLQSLKTRSHFFHRDPDYLPKRFLGPLTMFKVPKKSDMCQIWAIFSVL